MSKKIIITIPILIIIVGIWWFGLNNRSQDELTSPKLQQTSSENSSPTPAPPQTPKTFQFDVATDLKAELEKVNPQVLNSDFE